MNLEFTDTTIMPFGMHKGKTLANVPATYLLYLYNKGLDHEQLKKYIVANMDVLEQEAKKEAQYKR